MDALCAYGSDSDSDSSSPPPQITTKCSPSKEKTAQSTTFNSLLGCDYSDSDDENDNDSSNDVQQPVQKKTKLDDGNISPCSSNPNTSGIPTKAKPITNNQITTKKVSSSVMDNLPNPILTNLTITSTTDNRNLLNNALSPLSAFPNLPSSTTTKTVPSTYHLEHDTLQSVLMKHIDRMERIARGDVASGSGPILPSS